MFQGMNRPLVFLGPSLNREDAQKILDAEYRDPAKKGDFLKLATFSEGKRIIGFVDGVFLHDYPPSPIEVYQLLVMPNIMLVGSSSLGALRAVELEKYGMAGVGKIFELYRKKILFADDEVAVTFVQGENILQSEAMIDIRFNLFLAKRLGIIDEYCRKMVTKVGKNLYFPYRNYDDIISISQKEYPPLSEQLEKFKLHLTNNRDSLKARDTIKLLKYLKIVAEH